MKQIYLNFKHDDVEKVIGICRSYREWFDVDLKFGRYIVDGCSYLGALSIADHIVRVCPVPEDNEKIIAKLFEKLKPYGAYLGEEKI